MTTEHVPLRIDYAKVENVDIEPAIQNAMRDVGMDFFEYIIHVDKIGRIYATPVNGKHKKLIGIVDPDGTIHMRHDAKGYANARNNRTSISIYVSNDDFEKIARTAAMKGKNLSQFVRDILLAHYK